jgi:hypothetical protein
MTETQRKMAVIAGIVIMGAIILAFATGIL